MWLLWREINLCGYCGERLMCVDIAVLTNVCRYCGERPICVDNAVRDQSVWILP